MSESNHPHADLIRKLYTAFSENDAETMASCYHPEAEFEDPAFGKLTGKSPGNMWRMLLGRAKGNLKVSFSDVQADDHKGSAYWEAIYPFGPKKRKVHNKIRAEFEFRDGLIYRHRDDFDFYKWSRMALGTMGTLLGWSPVVKNKVRSTSLGLLRKFEADQK